MEKYKEDDSIGLTWTWQKFWLMKFEKYFIIFHQPGKVGSTVLYL